MLMLRTFSRATTAVASSPSCPAICLAFVARARHHYGLRRESAERCVEVEKRNYTKCAAAVVDAAAGGHLCGASITVWCPCTRARALSLAVRPAAAPPPFVSPPHHHPRSHPPHLCHSRWRRWRAIGCVRGLPAAFPVGARVALGRAPFAIAGVEPFAILKKRISW